MVESSGLLRKARQGRMEQAIHRCRQYRWRLGVMLFFDQWVLALMVYGLIAGTVLLIGKLLIPELSAVRWYIVGSGVVTVVVAGWRAFRRVPSLSGVRAMLDRRNRQGGLLMAEQEVVLGPWRERIGLLVEPTIRWRGGNRLALLMMSVVFLVGVLLVPQQYLSAGIPRPLHIEEDVERLAEQVAVLEEAEVVEEELADEIRRTLEQLHAEARGHDPVRTWESLDHIEQRLEQQAEEYALEAVGQTAEWTQAEELAEGLLEHGEMLSSDQLGEAQGELSRMLKELARENESLQKTLEQSCQNGCRSGRFSDEELKAIRQSLRQCKGTASKHLERMCQQRMIDPSRLSQCSRSGQCQSQQLMAYLKEHSTSQGMRACLGRFNGSRCGGGACAGSGPGMGSVGRGRGDAPMSWGDLSEADGARFEEQALPTGAMAGMEDSVILGIGLAEPDTSDAAATSGARVLAAGERAAGAAAGQMILPRHRDVVQRYFSGDAHGAGSNE